jgi:hypothetical protein
MPLPGQEQDGRNERGPMADAATLAADAVCSAAGAAAHSAAAAAERASLLLSLEEQARELRSVRAAVAGARSMVPQARIELWRGLAQLSYSIGVARLNLELARLEECLADACIQTTRAIRALDDRVG